MKKIITIFGHKFQLTQLILVFVATILLICLGNWQLNRLNQKQQFIDTIESNITNAAIEFDQNTIKLYSKVKLLGHFLDNKDIFLYGRRSAFPEKDGYYLISPFKTTNGEIIMVSRGWIPQSLRNNVTNFTFPNYEEIITMVLPGEEKNIFTPDNDLRQQIWFTLDLKLAVATHGITEKRFYLMQIESKNLPQGTIALSANNLSKIRNDHLEYAITWYSLAICLLAIYLVYNTKRFRK